MLPRGTGVGLDGLPPEILVLVLDRLDSADLIAAQPICRALQAAASDELLWRSRLTAQLGPVVEAFFDGALPPPRPGLSWKCHYFEFHATWLRLAQERTGRVLLKIGARPPLPPSPRDWSAFLWGEGKENWRRHDRTYGVYDVTDFMERHPGSPDLLLEAAVRADATHSFEMGAHSNAAMQMLATLAVPGLEAVPYCPEIEELQQRPRRCGGLFEHDRHLPWAWPQTCIVLVLLFATPVCGRCDALCGAIDCGASARDFLGAVPALPLAFLACSLCAALVTWRREGKPFLQSLPWSLIDLSQELKGFSRASLFSSERLF